MQLTARNQIIKYYSNELK